MAEKKKEKDKVAGTQLLDRAVAILGHLSKGNHEGMKGSELAELLELNASTAHRIISALEQHGLIERDAATKRFRLGLKLFQLGAVAADHSGYRRLFRPALQRIAAKTGDSVFLMGRTGPNSICVDRQEGSYIIDSLTGRIGGRIPLGVGPASQCILAFLDDAEAESIIAANADQYARFNNLSSDEIRERLPEIRQKGYAFDHGRLVEGISAIAVPIQTSTRDAIGSIAVNMTSARLKDDRLDGIVQLLKSEVEAAQALTNPLAFPAVSQAGGSRLYE